VTEFLPGNCRGFGSHGGNGARLVVDPTHHDDRTGVLMCLLRRRRSYVKNVQPNLPIIALTNLNICPISLELYSTAVLALGSIIPFPIDPHFIASRTYIVILIGLADKIAEMQILEQVYCPCSDRQRNCLQQSAFQAGFKLRCLLSLPPPQGDIGPGTSGTADRKRTQVAYPSIFRNSANRFGISSIWVLIHNRRSP
jgi:hypothetical protein